jgi:polyisoprenoid-binding protein YceI
MRKSFLTIVALLVASLGFTQSTEWRIDKAHTNVTFEITHLMIATVTGKFERFSGTIKSDTEDFTDLSVDFQIETASVNTNNERRDGHLRSDDFFDSEVNPYITFKSTKIEKTDGNRYKLTGDLTMNNVTHEVTFDVRHTGTIQDPWGGTRAGFRATSEIDRNNYNLTYNTALEGGGVLIGNNVDLRVNLELIKQ